MKHTGGRTRLAKSERLAARVTPEQKALLQRAADLAGQTLTEFVVDSAQATALREIEAHELIQLTRQDSERVADALLNPPDPAPSLQAAVQRYRQLLGG